MPATCCLICVLLSLLPFTVTAQQLSLREAIDYTLKNNDREMYRVEQNYLSAQLQHEISLAAYRPQVNVNVGASRSQSQLLNESDLYTSNSFSASPSLSMNYNLRTPFGSKTNLGIGYTSQINREGRFYHSPSLRLSYTQPLSLAGIQSGHLDYITTQQSFLRSEMTYKNAKENIILTAINNYFGLWRGIQEVEQSREGFESAERMLNIAELKLKAGEISEFEVLNTKVQYQLSRDNYQVAQNSLENRKREFKKMLGDKTDRDIDLIKEIQMDTVSIGLDEAFEKAMECRLDAQQWEIDLQLADLSFKQSRASLWPSLNLSSNYSLSSDYDTPYGSDLSRFPYRQWSISAGISYTIIDGGKRSRNIQTAEIAHNLRKKDFELYREDIRRLLEEHIRTLEMNLKRMKSLGVNLQMAEESLNIAEMKFKQGSISTTEVESIRDRYRSAQSSINSAKIEYITQSARLARDMGVLEVWVAALNQ